MHPSKTLLLTTAPRGHKSTSDHTKIPRRVVDLNDRRPFRIKRRQQISPARQSPLRAPNCDLTFVRHRPIPTDGRA